MTKRSKHTTGTMNCPYCLSPARELQTGPQGGYSCPVCKSIIPRSYVEQTHVPRATVGVVGFSGHGKTVFLTALFSVLEHFLPYWPGFYYRSLDDYTHKVLYEQVPLFKGGQLPDSTPANFPNPALLQYNHIPEFEHAFLNYYDTAGEVFLDSQQIKRAGYFVGHSDIVLFIVSLADCDFQELDNTMARLLDNYVRAVYDHLNVDLKQRQRIIVTFTKADLIAERLPRELYNWLKEGGADWYMRHIAQNRLLLNENSFQIENWLRDELGCNRFLNMLRGNFREVRFTLVSATGLPGEAGPAAQEQGPAYEPLRVMDPFLWILRFTQEYQPARRPNYPRPLRQLLQKLGW